SMIFFIFNSASTTYIYTLSLHDALPIFLLDEVLTTADVSFQKKCLGRIKSASRDGTAVIFVSHNLKSVTHLCERAFHFHRGEIQDRKSTRLNSSHRTISYAVFCLKKKIK